MKNETLAVTEDRKKKRIILKILLWIGIPIWALGVLFIVLVINSIVSNNKKISAGDEFFNKGEYALAIEQYGSAVGEGGIKNTEALKKRGFTYLIIGDYDNAILDLTESLKLVPNDPERYRYRAEAYEYMGDYANAIADFKMVLKLSPYSNSAIGVEGHIKELQNCRDRNKPLRAL